MIQMVSYKLFLNFDPVTVRMAGSLVRFSWGCIAVKVSLFVWLPYIYIDAKLLVAACYRLTSWHEITRMTYTF